MWTMLERRRGRELDAGLPESDAKSDRGPHRTHWMNFLAANVLPVAAGLTLAWAATIALVVISEVFSLSLVPGKSLRSEDSGRSAALRSPLAANSADNTVTAGLRR